MCPIPTAISNSVECQKSMEGLERHSENPILLPNQDAWWESKAVFNPAVLYDGKKVHMLYRAVGEYELYVSRVGYTFSEDGFNFKRTNAVVLEPNEGYEKYGTEDPKLTIVFIPRMWYSQIT